MASWPVQDAKARFSELLDSAIEKGPQVVTRRGVEVAVLVPVDEWRGLQRATRRGLKSLLLAPEPRFDSITEGRPKLRRRGPVEFK